MAKQPNAKKTRPPSGASNSKASERVTKETSPTARGTAPVQRATGGHHRDTWILFVLVVIVYVATATVSVTVVGKRAYFSNDVFFSAYPAWTIAKLQTLNIDTVITQLGIKSGWGFIVGDHLRSDRFPGPILWAVPFYLIAGGSRFSIGPSAVAAAVGTAIAVALMHRVLLQVVGRRTALGGALSFALATGAWSVSADSLWTHPTCLMGLALGTWMLARGNFAASGIGYAVAILSRPHTAVVAAITGIWESVVRRSWRPVVLTGLTSAVGLALLLGYNKLNAGSWDIFPGSYNGRFDAAINTGTGGQAQPTLWTGDIAATFFSPLRGLFVYSPFLLVLIPGIPAAWRAAPSWVRSSAIGAAVYFVIQLAGNTWIGATDIFGYRLPLEPLLLSSPLLALSYTAWTTRWAWSRWAFAVLSAVSVWWFAVGAVTRTPALNSLREEVPWSEWQVPLAVKAHSPIVLLLAAVLAVGVPWALSRIPTSSRDTFDGAV